MAHSLTAKQQRFIEEYLVDLNATRAYMAAFGSKNERAAAASAAKLLRKANISAEIARRQAERSQRVQVTQDYVLTNLTEVVERCMQRAPVMVRKGRHMVQLVDEEGRDVWQFDARGAVGALNLLGQHLAMFTKKIAHEGTVTLEDLLRTVDADDDASA